MSYLSISRLTKKSLNRTLKCFSISKRTSGFEYFKQLASKRYLPVLLKKLDLAYDDFKNSSPTSISQYYSQMSNPKFSSIDIITLLYCTPTKVSVPESVSRKLINSTYRFKSYEVIPLLFPYLSHPSARNLIELTGEQLSLILHLLSKSDNVNVMMKWVSLFQEKYPELYKLELTRLKQQFEDGEKEYLKNPLFNAFNNIIVSAFAKKNLEVLNYFFAEISYYGIPVSRRLMGLLLNSRMFEHGMPIDELEMYFDKYIVDNSADPKHVILFFQYLLFTKRLKTLSKLTKSPLLSHLSNEPEFLQYQLIMFFADKGAELAADSIPGWVQAINLDTIDLPPNPSLNDYCIAIQALYPLKDIGTKTKLFPILVNYFIKEGRIEEGIQTWDQFERDVLHFHLNSAEPEIQKRHILKNAYQAFKNSLSLAARTSLASSSDEEKKRFLSFLNHLLFAQLVDEEEEEDQGRENETTAMNQSFDPSILLDSTVSEDVFLAYLDNHSATSRVPKLVEFCLEKNIAVKQHLLTRVFKQLSRDHKYELLLKLFYDNLAAIDQNHIIVDKNSALITDLRVKTAFGPYALALESLIKTQAFDQAIQFIHQDLYNRAMIPSYSHVELLMKRLNINGKYDKTLELFDQFRLHSMDRVGPVDTPKQRFVSSSLSQQFQKTNQTFHQDNSLLVLAIEASVKGGFPEEAKSFLLAKVKQLSHSPVLKNDDVHTFRSINHQVLHLLVRKSEKEDVFSFIEALTKEGHEWQRELIVKECFRSLLVSALLENQQDLINDSVEFFQRLGAISFKDFEKDLILKRIKESRGKVDDGESSDVIGDGIDQSLPFDEKIQQILDQMGRYEVINQ